VLSAVHLFKRNVTVFVTVFLLVVLALSAPIARFHGSHNYNEWVGELCLMATGFGPTFADAFEPERPFQYLERSPEEKES